GGGGAGGGGGGGGNGGGGNGGGDNGGGGNGGGQTDLPPPTTSPAPPSPPPATSLPTLPINPPSSAPPILPSSQPPVPSTSAPPVPSGPTRTSAGQLPTQSAGPSQPSSSGNNTGPLQPSLSVPSVLPSASSTFPLNTVGAFVRILNTFRDSSSRYISSTLFSPQTPANINGNHIKTAQQSNPAATATATPTTTFPPGAAVAPSSSSSTSLSGSAITGIIIGGVAFVAAVVGIYIFRKWKLSPSKSFLSRRQAQDSEDALAPPTTNSNPRDPRFLREIEAPEAYIPPPTSSAAPDLATDYHAFGVTAAPTQLAPYPTPHEALAAQNWDSPRASMQLGHPDAGAYHSEDLYHSYDDHAYQHSDPGAYGAEQGQGYLQYQYAPHPQQLQDGYQQHFYTYQ
ncbi:hypothetical protein BDK51DRAFT_48229, partial [Blyttiomyces helicus]